MIAPIETLNLTLLIPTSRIAKLVGLYFSKFLLFSTLIRGILWHDAVPI